jgi:hypothetical protein
MPLPNTFGAASARGFGLFSAPATVLDPFFPYVTMLLHGDGTNGAQNNTFLDSSTNNFTITRNGNTTQGSFSPYGSNWSNYFGGSGNYLTIGSAANWQFLNSGASDYTIEAWVNLSSVSSQQFICATNSAGAAIGINFQITSSATLTLEFTRGVGGSFATFTSTGTLTANTWNHVAVTFATSGKTATFYINGVASGSSSNTGFSYSSSNPTNTLNIAREPSGTGSVTGYVSNLRIVSSIVYTGTFTPSTTPLTAITNTSLLTCQSNRFIDNSTNAFAITVAGNPSVQRFSPFSPSAAYSTSVIGGSGYFDGGSDYLRLASGTTGVNGSAFTICLWFYPLNSSVVGLFDSDPNTVGCFRNYTTNTIEDQNNVTKVNFANTYQVNAWNWMCITKSGTSFTVRINGTSIGTGNCATNMSENEFTVGAINGGGDGSYLGYISDFQILNTSTVVSPPTAPLTNASGKTLLLNFTNGGIFDNAMMNNLETVGNAQISTSVFKYGTGSLAFDGSGDDLRVVNAGVTTGFGTGNFTVEFWVYANTWSSFNNLVDFRKATDYFMIHYNAGAIRFYNNGSNRITGSSLSTSTWYHIAVCRSGTSTKMFVDGTQVGSTYTDSTNYPVETVITIGARNDDIGNPFNGYIDDLRITKGYARYTANFTPPTAAFPNQ